MQKVTFAVGYGLCIDWLLLAMHVPNVVKLPLSFRWSSDVFTHKMPIIHWNADFSDRCY